MSKHAGEKLHECTQCGKGFSRSEHLVKHISMRTEDNSYEC